MEKIIPRGNWILIKPVEEESNKLENGILLPSNEERDKKAIGFVEAIGYNVKDIKNGDKVIFGAFAGEIVTRIEDEKEVTYQLLLDEDIIAFLK